MIVDSSALLAILYREPDAPRYEQLIATTPNCPMSLEASIVVEGRGGAEASVELDAFLESTGIVLAPVTLDQFSAARRAWRLFGKGNHPAALNFGDCFAYALAAVSGEPLLFKGNDFPAPTSRRHCRRKANPASDFRLAVPGKPLLRGFLRDSTAQFTDWTNLTDASLESLEPHLKNLFTSRSARVRQPPPRPRRKGPATEQRLRPECTNGVSDYCCDTVFQCRPHTNAT